MTVGFVVLTCKQRDADLKGRAPSLLVFETLSLHTSIHMNFKAAKGGLRVIEGQFIKLIWMVNFNYECFRNTMVNRSHSFKAILFIRCP